MALIKVKNISGTGKQARQIGSSWLNFWEKQIKRKATRCLAYSSTFYQCDERINLVGGHVKKVYSSDNRWYILPICRSHNAPDVEFWVYEEDLVLATSTFF